MAIELGVTQFEGTDIRIGTHGRRSAWDIHVGTMSWEAFRGPNPLGRSMSTCAEVIAAHKEGRVFVFYEKRAVPQIEGPEFIVEVER